VVYRPSYSPSCPPRTLSAEVTRDRRVAQLFRTLRSSAVRAMIQVINWAQKHRGAIFREKQNDIPNTSSPHRSGDTLGGSLLL
jgi:hypothetical protein